MSQGRRIEQTLGFIRLRGTFRGTRQLNKPRIVADEIIDIPSWMLAFGGLVGVCRGQS